MKNKHTISFYHPKACQAETSATPFTQTQRSRAHARALAHTTGSDYIHKNSWGCYEYHPPYILFLSFIYIKNVYSRREGHFGGVLSVW